MVSRANPARGEASVRIAGNDYVLAAEMEDLAVLAEAIGDPPLNELVSRLLGGSVHATRIALRVFARSGTTGQGTPMDKRTAGDTAVRDYTLADAIAVQKAFSVLFEPLLGGSRESDQSQGNLTAAPS